MEDTLPLSQLISADPAWPQVRSWVEAAGDRATVLPCVTEDGEKTLMALQWGSRERVGRMPAQST